eukprot:1866210-Pleurochrysis_carterae.AAC.1
MRAAAAGAARATGLLRADVRGLCAVRVSRPRGGSGPAPVDGRSMHVECSDVLPCAARAATSTADS